MHKKATTTTKGKKRGGDPRWDHYSTRAKSEGYKARSVYKLEEIDKRFRIFGPGKRVLDLGCHPGSWLQYAAEKVGRNGAVIGIDRAETRPPSSNTRTFQADLTEPFDNAALGGPFDIVTSDMAPDTTGIRHVDQDRSANLAEIALEMAERHGKQNSSFVVKVFQGPAFNEYLVRVKQSYAQVRCVRPDATRKASIEVYVVATGKRQGPPEPEAAPEPEQAAE